MNEDFQEYMIQANALMGYLRALKLHMESKILGNGENLLVPQLKVLLLVAQELFQDQDQLLVLQLKLAVAQLVRLQIA